MSTILKYKRPKMYPKQEQAIFNDSRYALVEASTKSGKTVSCLVWLIEQAMHGKDGYVYWWVAPSYSQSKIVYRRMKKWLDRDMVQQFNESELTVTLVNGTRIFFRSGDNYDNLYGEDCYAIVIDEASRLREDAFIACRSTVTSTQGKIRMIGNVRGRKNWFYKLCRRAEQGLDNYHYAKITAVDAIDGGVLDKEEINEAKTTLPKNIFDELYMSEGAEDNGKPFWLDAIQKCISPMSRNAPFVYGVDLAKSVDFTAVVGLDSNGVVCFFDLFQLPWNQTKQRLIEIIGSTDCIVDSTGVGDSITEDLQRVLPRVEGFKFSSTSKQQLMELLSSRISTQQVHFPDNEIVSELMNFEYEYSRTGVKYSAPNGLHDDCVMALALALKGLNNVPGMGVW